jgi:hypothetical protein
MLGYYFEDQAPPVLLDEPGSRMHHRAHGGGPLMGELHSGTHGASPRLHDLRG